MILVVVASAWVGLLRQLDDEHSRSRDSESNPLPLAQSLSLQASVEPRIVDDARHRCGQIILAITLRSHSR